MSYPDFLSAIFGTNQQAAIREYQSLYRLQTRYPELLQNATPHGPHLQQQSDYAARQAAGAQNAISYWAAKGVANAAWMPEPTQWDQDYEEAMREVDEIAPGWKE